MDKTPELSSKARLRFWFPEWPLALRAAGLSERRQESYAIAIRWYLSYCKRAHVPVDPDSARQFLEAQCREHPAAGAFGDSWREAITWFMEEGSRLVQLRRDLEAYRATSRDRQYHPSLAGSESPVRQVAAAGQGSPAGQWEEALGRVVRLKRYSPRTERVYLDWGRRLQRRFGPLDQQGSAQVREFLEELAVKDRVGASTQRQALNALVFVFREALGKPLGDLGDYRRARVRQRLPVCLTWAQLQRLFAAMKGPQRLMAQLMFGTGLRLREMLQLRVMDLDFGHGLVMVRRGKGNQDRATPMPRRLRGELEEHLQRVREQFEADRQAGVGPVWLPEDLARRYPEAGHRWEWQWVWPSRELTREGEGGVLRRHHLRERVLQEAIREGAKRADIAQHVTPHALRHSYATELLRRGANIRQVQELLGHSEVSTTLVYSHVLARPGVQIVSPVDD